MMITILIATIVILIIGWWIERLRCKAIIYYLVDNECTAPTKEDIERCIRVVVTKTVDGWLKNSF